MKKAILVKTENGIKDTFEITLTMFDGIAQMVVVGLKHLYVRDGVPVVEDSQHTFNENYVVNVLAPDPEWTALSIPPRPDGFDFEDPSTWGDLNITQIPLVKKIQKQTKLMELFQTEVDCKDEFGFIVESNVLRYLQTQGTLPADYELSFKEI